VNHSKTSDQPVLNSEERAPAAWRTNFRRVVLNLHLYAGIAALLFGMIFGLTGAVLAFERQIDNWLIRDLANVPASPIHLPLTDLMQNVSRAYPGFEISAIRLPAGQTRAITMFLAERKGKQRFDLYVDGHTGRILGACGQGCAVVDGIRKLHTSLMMGRPGVMVMGYATAVLLFLACSGIYLWWKRKLLSINPRLRFWRVNYDLHHALGFYIAPLVIIFALTGLTVAFQWPRNLLFRLNAPGTSQGPRNPPPSKVVPGASRRSLDSQIVSAEQALSGMQVIAINLPRRAADADMIFMVPAVKSAWQPKATIAYIDQYTGRVLKVWRSSEFGLGSRILSYNVQLHTGSIWGWPSEVLMCLASLGLSILCVSGILIWWKREIA
jgi:uncharacterized iron-regulated membrane protein